MALPNNLVYPKARLRLLDAQYRPSAKLAVLNRVQFHSTASDATSQYGYFNASGRASSHLHLDKAGNWEQYQYLDLQSEADYQGNDATWSVETQGVSAATGDEPWTDAQVKELAEFYQWSRGFGVLNQLATTSKSGSDTSKGLSWHRQGIDGNFPVLPSIQAGRLQRGGGMYYSTASGKVCPGYARIEQIPYIFQLSQGTPVPAPIPPVEVDVFIAAAVNNGVNQFGLFGPGYYTPLSQQEVYLFQNQKVPLGWQTVAEFNQLVACVTRGTVPVAISDPLAEAVEQSTIAATREVPVDTTGLTATVSASDKQEIAEKTVALMPKTLS
jgi:hypothetical protein